MSPRFSRPARLVADGRLASIVTTLLVLSLLRALILGGAALTLFGATVHACVNPSSGEVKDRRSKRCVQAGLDRPALGDVRHSAVL